MGKRDVKLIEVLKEEQGNLNDAVYARSLGLVKSTIYTWYNGKRLPSVRSAHKVCKALGLDIDKTTEIVNQLEDIHEQKRLSDPVVQAELKAEAKRKQSPEMKESVDLTRKFVSTGEARGLSKEQLIEGIGSLSINLLYNHLAGNRVVSKANQVIMKRYIKHNSDEYLFVDVPEELPEDYSLITEQVIRIGQSKGLPIISVSSQLGNESESNIHLWRNNGAIPRYDRIMAMVDYIEEFNEELPKEKQIDPYSLMPETTQPKRIRIGDYGLLHELEEIYGAMEYVPDDSPMLQELRAQWGIVV